jgi:hypothetical protein
MSFFSTVPMIFPLRRTFFLTSFLSPQYRNASHQPHLLNLTFFAAEARMGFEFLHRRALPPWRTDVAAPRGS